MKTNAIVPGSLSAVSKRDGVSLEQSFMGADVVILADMSGSMYSADAPGGLSRFDAAERDIRCLQEQHAGKVALLVFSNDVRFCPGGVPQRLAGNTNLAGALKFIHVCDDTGMKIILISDGMPDDPDAALREAKKFKTKIDCIFIGPESDTFGGRAFLQRLAAATGGQFIASDAPGELLKPVETLMLTS
jgi:Mg-chelatase subunit ChlD